MGLVKISKFLAMTKQAGPRDCVLYAESVRLQSKLMFAETANKVAIKAECELMTELSSWLSQLRVSDVDDKTKPERQTAVSKKRSSDTIDIPAATTTAGTESRKKRKR